MHRKTALTMHSRLCKMPVSIVCLLAFLVAFEMANVQSVDLTALYLKLLLKLNRPR